MSEKQGKSPSDLTLEGIKKIICQSGYLLELEIASLLEKNGWDVFFQYSYYDKKQDKVRAADLLCFRKKLIGDFSHHNKVAIIIECKKSSKHGWAFHTIPKRGSQVGLWLLAEMLERIDEIKTGDVNNDLHWLKMDTKIATHCCIPPNHPDDFYEALNQILSDVNNIGLELKNTLNGFTVFPIILFDGPMWEFYNENDALKVKEIDYVQFLSSALKTQEVKSYLIDIVKKSYFEQFLHLLDKTINTINK